MQSIYIALVFIAVFAVAYTIASRRYKQLPQYVCIVDRRTQQFCKQKLWWIIAADTRFNICLSKSSKKSIYCTKAVQACCQLCG